MTKISIEISCCLCSASHKTEIQMPEGWEHKNDGIDNDKAFCPQHAAVLPFVNEQCPGCVSGWGDCGLWQDFAMGRHRLDDGDFAKIRTGICPRRINGTFCTTGRGIQALDISKQAPTEAGAAMEAAIRDYWVRYPAR